MIRWPEGFTRMSPVGGVCVPIAVSILAGRADELDLLRKLRALRIMGPRGGVYDFTHQVPRVLELAGLKPQRVVVAGSRMLSDSYYMYGTKALSCVRLDRGMTIATFAKLYDRGRWIVTVANHVVALVDGQLFGYHNPRSRLEWALQVTKERGHRASVSE